ncbi:RNA polymerase sigma-70 factor [Rapidithrix thailandica]|uniref:RNA polymerase sigma-70 factor n=1 Tax=Rapidithrix thailandica TaxID=413964 RepID=A0AAW9RN04_9BACT
MKNQLASELKKGNCDALKEVYNKYWYRLYRLSMKYLSNQEDAEEAVQDVMLKLWKYRENIREDKELDGYLLKIAQNTLLNTLRKKKLSMVPLTGDTVLSYQACTTEHEVLANELENISEELLSQLSPRRYKIFCLSRKKGLSYEEIAKKLNISKKTVENQMFFTLSYLRKKLKEYRHAHLSIMLIGMVWFYHIVQKILDS